MPVKNSVYKKPSIRRRRRRLLGRLVPGQALCVYFIFKTMNP